MATTTPSPKDQLRVPGEVAALAEATDIDRRKCKRTVPLRVLALGVSRSGTASLRQALVDLGYKDCYHCATPLQENPRDMDVWNEAYEAKFENKGEPFTRKDWDQLLGHCQAVTDTPCIVFYKELLEAYPDAKVILTIRDNPDQWFKSMMSTIIPYIEAIAPPNPSVFDRTYRLFAPMDKRFYKFVGHQCNYPPMWKTLLKDRQDGTELAKQWYLDYIEEIKSLVSKEKLLVMNVKEGWAPLCQFLGQEEPPHPFPRRNDTQTFQQNTTAFGKVISTVVALNVLKTVGAVMAVGVAAGFTAHRYGLLQRGRAMLGI